MFLRRFRRNEDGVVAIEFSMIAPVFIFTLMAMADLGLAAYDRMKLTTGVRNAAQYVMFLGDDQGMIKEIVLDSSGLGEKIIAIEINDYCACSGSEGTPMECSVECEGGNMTNVYKRVSAVAYSKQLLKSWKLSSSAEVRIR
jgi:Flp pilus assembly pilin Flp